MDFERIERLMRMLEQSSLAEMDVTEGGVHIRLAKRRAGTAFKEGDVPPEPVSSEPAEGDPNGRRQIRAGMAGTFYHAPSPGSQPFAAVGMAIREGDQLGIVEAMKMFNPVEAEADGVVEMIHVADGDSVEPGMVLFTITASRHG
jgi:acetyl-CoA carboxylase biotin carboxyl carrier protein